jgi:Ca2+-binding EF-hand superfamily protein
MFSAFDNDSSGIVSFEEFLISISLSGKNDPRQKLHLAFRIFGKIFFIGL